MAVIFLKQAVEILETKLRGNARKFNKRKAQLEKLDVRLTAMIDNDHGSCLNCHVTLPPPVASIYLAFALREAGLDPLKTIKAIARLNQGVNLTLLEGEKIEISPICRITTDDILEAAAELMGT